MHLRELRFDDADEIQLIYKKAFAGFPWFEDLSAEEVADRWQTQSNKPGFKGIVASGHDGIMAALWWDKPSLTVLTEERGLAIAQFAKEYAADTEIIWEREVIVDPAFQGQGIGRDIRKHFITLVGADYGNKLVLTRMRNDNAGIIRIAEKIGFKRTGICMPCSIKPEVNHEYWYFLLNPRN